MNFLFPWSFLIGRKATCWLGTIACFSVAFGNCPGAEEEEKADPNEWEIVTTTGDDLFPSILVATSTMKASEEEEEPDVLGDPNGQIGVELTSPADDAKVKFEVAAGEFIKASRYEVKLPEKGRTYWVYPYIKYNYDALLRIRQPVPEDVTITVTADGKEMGEKTKRVTMRSINDCPFVMLDEEEKPFSTAWLFAAYVNENHPKIDKILSEALKEDRVNSFAGYQGDADQVLGEVEAIWDTLQSKGFHYSNITQASRESEDIASQHVRLIGDALGTSQANCVEGSVIFASILRKLDMDPFLVLIPGHMFVGVYLDADHNEYACIETTMLNEDSFEDAVKVGNKEYEEHEEGFEDEDALDTEVIEIEDWRKEGLLPLREVKAEKDE